MIGLHTWSRCPRGSLQRCSSANFCWAGNLRSRPSDRPRGSVTSAYHFGSHPRSLSKRRNHEMGPRG
jgi:hypothetical protein